MYNPDNQPDTEPNFPFMRPSGPTHGGECNLKPEWQKIGSEALAEANVRGYTKHSHQNYSDLCDFVRQNSAQLYIEGIEGGLSGKILGGEIAFRHKSRHKESSIKELAEKGVITITDCGTLGR